MPSLSLSMRTYFVTLASTSSARRRRSTLAALAALLCMMSLPVLADVTLQRGPPPPRFEKPHAAPQGQFWVPGYWQWSDGRYAWVDGHMAPKRPGMRYTPPHWEETGDHEWTLRDGMWESTGWGPGTIHEIRAPK